MLIIYRQLLKKRQRQVNKFIFKEIELFLKKYLATPRTLATRRPPDNQAKKRALDCGITKQFSIKGRLGSLEILYYQRLTGFRLLLPFIWEIVFLTRYNFPVTGLIGANALNYTLFSQSIHFAAGCRI